MVFILKIFFKKLVDLQVYLHKCDTTKSKTNLFFNCPYNWCKVKKDVVTIS